jgi:type II secretory pathway predicted ATPase ExeA
VLQNKSQLPRRLNELDSNRIQAKDNMVTDYYSLTEQPFGVTPDTRYLYLSPTHREALASLLYGVQTGRGFMSIIAKPGMGKTTLLFQLLQQLKHSARTVFLFQTLCSPVDLLRSLLRDLGMEAHGDLPEMHSQLNECLLTESRRGKQVVVVIDEAQNLSDEAFELLRMLSNFETPHQKLTQIILAGQPQLAEKLASPNLVQLRQRISIVARLKPLTLQETNLYVGHRLGIAGYHFRSPLFTGGAGAIIAEHSEGIPRNINNICFNALSLGCALKRKPIDEGIIREVMGDLDLGSENEMAMTIHEPKKSAPRAPTALANCGMRTHGRAWLSKCATVAMLMLMWPIGVRQRDTKVFASQNSAAAATKAAQSSSRILSVSPSAPDSQARTTAPKNSPAPKSPAPETGRSKVIVDPRTATQSSRSVEPHARETSIINLEIDPTELWKEIKNGSTSAEVALASLYLDGVVVPQSCPQAQVLLSAARKKGNHGAENLLATYEKRCQ